MSRERLRAAVIGVGAFGRHHARIYRDLEQAGLGVHLVGLVDIDSEGPQETARRLGVPYASRLEDLDEPVDLVSVAVPTIDHRRVAEPLLRRGIHCLIEKPLAGSSADATALEAAAAEGRAVLQVGLVERFNPVMAALDRLGAAPSFIEVHRLAPYPQRGADTGVVMDTMIHDLDLVNHVVGEESEKVEAVGVPVVGPNEDIANARITFPSGCVANVTASRVSLQRMRRFRIFSEDGYLALDYDKREALLVVPPGGDLSERGAAMAGVRQALEAAHGDVDHAADLLRARLPHGADPTRAGRFERLEIGDAEPLKEELIALVHTIASGKRPLVGCEDGLRALRLAERILEDVRCRPAPGREAGRRS